MLSSRVLFVLFESRKNTALRHERSGTMRPSTYNTYCNGNDDVDPIFGMMCRAREEGCRAISGNPSPIIIGF